MVSAESAGPGILLKDVPLGLVRMDLEGLELLRMDLEGLELRVDGWRQPVNLSLPGVKCYAVSVSHS